MADDKVSILQEMQENAREEGREEGRTEARESIAVNLIRLGRMSLIDVSVVCNVPLKRVQQLIAQA